MLELSRYSCLGAALRDAVRRDPTLTCLIEANRDRENARLTYAEFRAAGESIARGLQDSGFRPGDRAAIIMTNQSKWLVSAYAIFYCGGVLVPIDYKLTGNEQAQLLNHSSARVLVTEFHLWRAMESAPDFADLSLETSLVTDVPPNAALSGAQRWESFGGEGEAEYQPRARSDTACIVYSSGTGGRPKGCMLTHGNYLEQCRTLLTIFSMCPGDRYLSILPTNHAIDFMVGFIGPFVCGATVVHLRTLRPEFIKSAFTDYGITYMAVVPMILKNLERGLRERFAALPAHKRAVLNSMIWLNRALTRRRPNVALSSRLLPQIHRAFGGRLKVLFVGGAFTEPAILRFFYDLGIPVANGYGLTEAGTAITLNDLAPFRADTVGKPLPGVDLRIDQPDDTGVGEVAVRSNTIMSGYLDDAELTAETIVDGWLMTGDQGKLDGSGHLRLFGRKKNMIVTPGGKNVYPEDIETAFEGLGVKEFCVFASNFIWPRTQNIREDLVIVLRPDDSDTINTDVLDDLVRRNRALLDFKRVGSYVLWSQEFPRTASMKIKREQLARCIAAERDGPTAEVGA